MYFTCDWIVSMCVCVCVQKNYFFFWWKTKQIFKKYKIKHYCVIFFMMLFNATAFLNCIKIWCTFNLIRFFFKCCVSKPTLWSDCVVDVMIKHMTMTWWCMKFFCLFVLIQIYSPCCVHYISILFWGFVDVEIMKKKKYIKS